MTEPKPCTQYEVETEYLNDGNWPPPEPSESEIQAQCVKALRKAGAFVVVTSQNRRTWKQLSGLPDVLAFWYGHTLLLEFKAPGGSVRSSQHEFWRHILKHTNPYLHFAIVDSRRGLAWAMREWRLVELADALEGE